MQTYHYHIPYQMLNSTASETNCIQDTAGDDSLVLDTVKISGLEKITGVTVNGQMASVTQNTTSLQQTVDGFRHTITSSLNMIFTI